MELSERSETAADSPAHRWAKIMGTLVAVLTLTLPILMIAYRSPSRSNAQPLRSNVNLLPEIQNYDRELI